jgi:nucleosome assembly protein 1-like 1
MSATNTVDVPPAHHVSRTPQNTPLNAAPISSRAQQPGVDSIKEGKSVISPRCPSSPPARPPAVTSLTANSDFLPTEDLERQAASMFAANPALASLMQAKLSGLVGRSSGYIESLPGSVRRRVAGLKGIQKDHSKLEAEFQEEVLQLEKKYFAKFTPLYQSRAKIINGETEPTEEQVTVGEKKDDDDDEDDVPEEELNKDEGKDVKGIPEFWLSAMKNQISLAEMITDRDEGALKHLTDIRMEYLDRPGFRLIFAFEENEYFTNKAITKTYFYQEENGYGGDFIYDHAEGDKIEWKDGKDLTVRVESKKQRNKSMYSFNYAARSDT